MPLSDAEFRRLYPCYDMRAVRFMDGPKRGERAVRAYDDGELPLYLWFKSTTPGQLELYRYEKHEEAYYWTGTVDE